jgi:hypothetical protein
MRTVHLFFGITYINARSLFPQPRPTTLGYHPDKPNILIPVPLFPFDMMSSVHTTEKLKVTTSSSTKTVSGPTETVPGPTETVPGPTETIPGPIITAPMARYTAPYIQSREPFTLKETDLNYGFILPIITPNSSPKSISATQSSSTAVPTTTPFPKSTVTILTTSAYDMIITTTSEDKYIDRSIKDGISTAWDVAKEIGSLMIGGVSGIFNKISSLFY